MILKAGIIHNEDSTEDAIFIYEEDYKIRIENKEGDLLITIDTEEFIGIAEAIKAEKRENLITKVLLKELKK